MSEGSNLRVGRVSPVVDYTSNDFAGVRADLISYMQANYPTRWTTFNDDEFAMALLEAVAYVSDLNNYQWNAGMRELFSGSALRRANLRKVMQPFGVEPGPPESATGPLTVTLNPAGAYPFTITKDFSFADESTDDPVYYSPVSDLVVSAYSVNGATFDVVEGERFSSQLIGVSNGKPLQKWQFPQDNVVVSSVELRVGSALWTRVDSWAAQTSTSRSYRIVFNDDGNVFASFGDGVFGAIPTTSQQITVTGRSGGGKRGNKAATGLVTSVVSGHANILSVTNSGEITGGDNAQSMRAARNAIPSALHTLGTRAVSTPDYATVAAGTSGVLKARAVFRGGRRIGVVVAPVGGGAPSDTLKNSVGLRLREARIPGRRCSVEGPTYRDLRQSYLLHVGSAFKASDVEGLFLRGLINGSSTGRFDFPQLDFAGLDADDEPYVSATNIQAFVDSLSARGLLRAEVLQCDVEPLARARAAGNHGDGVVENIALNGRQRRREFYVKLTSSTSAIVYERILGRVYGLTDTTLVDDEKVFDDESSSYSGWKLCPDDQASAELTVVSATGQNVTVASGSSLFGLTLVGNSYFLYDPAGVALNVGDTFTSTDGSVSFDLTAGATAFLANDAFSLDVYPPTGDIVLRFDEYPRLTSTNLAVRTSGGARS